MFGLGLPIFSFFCIFLYFTLRNTLLETAETAPMMHTANTITAKVRDYQQGYINNTRNILFLTIFKNIFFEMFVENSTVHILWSKNALSKEVRLLYTLMY